MIGAIYRKMLRQAKALVSGKPSTGAAGKKKGKGKSGQSGRTEPVKKEYHRAITQVDPDLIGAMRAALLDSRFADFHAQFEKIGRGAFTDSRKKVLKADHCETERPVFIAGVHRSGTTLLETLVHTHFKVRWLRAKVPEHEGQFLQDVLEDEVVYGGPGLFAFFQQMHADPVTDPVQAAALRTTLLAEWETWTVGEPGVLLEKTPSNIVRIPFLRSIFPEARFVIMVRDPRAVTLSVQKWNKSPKEILFMNWCAAHSSALKALGPDCLIVRYEDLCADTQGQLNRIGDFAGLAARPELTAVPQRFSDVVNSNQAYIDRFGKMPDDMRRRIVFRPWELFGYDLSGNFE